MTHIRNSRSSRRTTSAKRRANLAARASERPAVSVAGRALAHIRGKRHRLDGQAGRVPRQQRATQTVEAIVSAAANLLVERGYAATSTNVIAERAGVSIG